MEIEDSWYVAQASGDSAWLPSPHESVSGVPPSGSSEPLFEVLLFEVRRPASC